jgi:transcriptional regulator with XRE-family HTH domain
MEVYEIRNDHGTYAEIAERSGISASQVGNIKRGDQRALNITRNKL